jgi:hypothetical protein
MCACKLMDIYFVRSSLTILANPEFQPYSLTPFADGIAQFRIVQSVEIVPRKMLCVTAVPFISQI